MRRDNIERLKKLMDDMRVGKTPMQEVMVSQPESEQEPETGELEDEAKPKRKRSVKKKD
jgi:hypothetical protein